MNPILDSPIFCNVLVYKIKIEKEKNEDDFPYGPNKRLNMIGLPNVTDYYNEGHTSHRRIKRKLPSMLTHLDANVSLDVNYLVQDFNIWKLVKLFVRRPANLKEGILNTLKSEYPSIYHGQISSLIFHPDMPSNAYFYALNAVILSNERLDAFHICYVVKVSELFTRIIRAKWRGLSVKCYAPDPEK
ncbi:hypothetical protein RF11_00913 [Thelohanellus kitauei]|uniref:Uncharacterized protein n=1 Tax=Thelohanellus kitauei TaxID=669202 RepID=A0A0C2MV82_THEKT|nr:hypothetical protein RF11_00913 [Thelohanellus kitauei]